MAHLAKQVEALRLRKSGASYSQIQAQVKVSKSTLSNWLREYPLSPERINELRSRSARRIERYRMARALRREERWRAVQQNAAQTLGILSERDLYIGGLFLYWGEGTKRSEACTAITNTDPSVLVYFIHWLEQVGVERKVMKARLHLYADMDISALHSHWSTMLGISLSNFQKPHIKTSSRANLSYAQPFPYGTCSVMYYGRDMQERIRFSLDHLRSQFAPVNNA